MADAPANRPVSNPWLTAQREWDERFAFHAATARRFFWFGLAALVMGATGLGFGIWAASQSEYVPYLVKVDDLGRAEALPQPATLDEWPTIVIKRELQTFIERARSIPADREILERNLHRLYRFLSTDSPAYRILTDFYQDAATNPIVRWAQETAVVTVTSVTYAGGSVLEGGMARARQRAPNRRSLVDNPVHRHARRGGPGNGRPADPRDQSAGLDDRQHRCAAGSGWRLG